MKSLPLKVDYIFSSHKLQKSFFYTLDARNDRPLLNCRRFFKPIRIYSPEESLFQVHVIEILRNLVEIALMKGTKNSNYFKNSSLKKNTSKCTSSSTPMSPFPFPSLNPSFPFFQSFTTDVFTAVSESQWNLWYCLFNPFLLETSACTVAILDKAVSKFFCISMLRDLLFVVALV